jgi:hypothetical protein
MVVTVITTFDQRRDKAYPVARRVIPITILNTESSAEVTEELSGRIIKMIYDIPNLTGAGTVTIDVLDEDDSTYYQKAAIAENAKTVDVGMVAAATPHGIAVAGAVTFVATASAGAQTGDQLINVIVYIM